MYRNIGNAILNLLFPPHNDVEVSRTLTVADAYDNFTLYKTDGGIYTALPYRESGVRSLIRANKFHDDSRATHILASVLGEILTNIMEEYALAPEWRRPLLIPIPASPKRLRKRGVNQVEQIIKALPKEILRHFEYSPYIVEREHRESQVRVGKHKREENIRGAFYVSNQKLIEGKYIIVVDDVVESGATMKDAARALQESGAQEIICIALAH